ncbi:MAG: metallopeptidase family protein [Propionibacteriaceae bacterium]
MPKTRERHGRGMRGPLSTANPITGEAAPRQRQRTAENYFTYVVKTAVSRIQKSCPEGLKDVSIGIEDVPQLSESWDEAIPLAAALEKTSHNPAQIVVYRRPLELRAQDRNDLALLVHRTIVEQLSAITGLEPSTIDSTYEIP